VSCRSVWPPPVLRAGVRWAKPELPGRFGSSGQKDDTCKRNILLRRRDLFWCPATTDDPETAADHTASAAERQPSDSRAAAERQPGCSKLHCTSRLSIRSDLSKATSRRSSWSCGLTHGAASGWACNRENMGERRTDAERPGPTEERHERCAWGRLLRSA
jgi:hypothetical protein